MNRIIINLISVCMCATLASCHTAKIINGNQSIEGSDLLSPCKPYTLSIELMHMSTGEHLVQTIDVDERESFRVTLFQRDTKWSCGGTIGEVTDEHMNIELTTQWYLSENDNRTSTMPLKLKINVDDMPLIGGLRGYAAKASVVKN